VSLYQVQQCLFDYLRALENAPADGPRPALSTAGYTLDERERAALDQGDISEIYALGTHPVIINGYCRAMGYKRADYRPLLQKVAEPQVKRTRWQK